MGRKKKLLHGPPTEVAAPIMNTDKYDNREKHNLSETNEHSSLTPPQSDSRIFKLVI